MKEANNMNNIIEFLKPGTRGLIEIIADAMKATNMSRRVRRSWWRVYINFLLKISVKEAFFISS